MIGSLYVVIAVWLVYCGGKGISGLMEFQSTALIADDTVQTLRDNLPVGGRVLIVTDAWKMRELPTSLHRHFQFAGRGDIALEAMDTSPKTSTLSAKQLRLRIQRENVPRAVTGEKFETYDAVIFMPPWKMMPKAIKQKISPTFSAVPVGRKSRWHEQARETVYIRKPTAPLPAE